MTKFNHKRFSIGGFQKTRTNRPMNLNRRTNHLLRQLIHPRLIHTSVPSVSPWFKLNRLV